MSFFLWPRFSRVSLLALLALEVLSFLFFFDFSHRLTLEMESERPLLLQAYWARPGKGYDEKSSRSVSVPAGKSILRLDFSELPLVSRIRIDPGQAPGRIRLVSLAVSRPLLPVFLQDGKSGWKGLRPLADIGAATTTAAGLHLEMTGADPQLELTLSSRAGIVWSWLWYVLKSGAVGLACWFFFFSGWRRLRNLPFFVGSRHIFARERDSFGPSAPFLFFLLFVLFAFFFFDDSYHLRLETEVKAPATLRVYWAGVSGGYNEAFSAPLSFAPGAGDGQMRFSSLTRVQRLRLDLPPEAEEFCVKRLSLQRRLSLPLDFSRAGDFAAFRPLHDIASMEYVAGRGLCIRPVPEPPPKAGRAFGRDPYLELDAAIVPAPGDFFRWTALWLTFSLAAALACWCILLWAANRLTPYFSRTEPLARAVALALALAALLAAVMAFVSPYRLHPDEHVHFTAAEYFSTHWLPPAIGGPGLDETYSVYGFSRLNNFDSSYWLAGAFMRLARTFTGPGHVEARLFCVALLASLALVAFCRRRFAVCMAVLLVTPQIWYVFSYINNDALPLFLTTLLACVLADDKNALFTDTPGLGPAPLAAVGIMAGMLFLEKDNFLVFLLYAFLFSVWKIFFSGPGKALLLRRLAVVFTVALLVVSARYGLDYAINGAFLHREARILAVAEKMAQPALKPSLYNAQQSYYGINLRAKGTSFAEIFSHWKWHLITAQSLAGEFGLKNMPSPPWYYRLVYYLYAGIFFYLLGRGIERRNLYLTGMTILTAGAVGGLVLVSAYSSWTSDFQAQGRYLFPLAGVMLLYAREVWGRVNRALVGTVLVAFFLLSLYSFMVSGILPMAAIPR